MIQDPYTLGGELKNPIGLIESFSILAALEEFAPDQRWIVQEKLYPKTEMADWKNVLNDEGRMFVKNIDIIIKKFNSWREVVLNATDEDKIAKWFYH